MREIKFRVWIKSESLMTDAGDIHFDYCGWNKVTGSQKITSIAYRKRKEAYVSDFELMQYTGNTDRNEKEIYEDDLVADEHGRIYRVVFKGDCWRCEPISRGSKNRWLSNYLKIIGNIYQHPELLGDSQ